MSEERNALLGSDSGQQIVMYVHWWVCKPLSYQKQLKPSTAHHILVYKNTMKISKHNERDLDFKLTGACAHAGACLLGNIRTFACRSHSTHPKPILAPVLSLCTPTTSPQLYCFA